MTIWIRIDHESNYVETENGSLRSGTHLHDLQVSQSVLPFLFLSGVPLRHATLSQRRWSRIGDLWSETRDSFAQNARKPFVTNLNTLNKANSLRISELALENLLDHWAQNPRGDTSVFARRSYWIETLIFYVRND